MAQANRLRFLLAESMQRSAISRGSAVLSASVFRDASRRQWDLFNTWLCEQYDSRTVALQINQLPPRPSEESHSAQHLPATSGAG